MLNRKFLLIVLLLISNIANAEIQTTSLNKLNDRMLHQSLKVEEAFQKHGISTKGDAYRNIWLEEFNVIYNIADTANTLEILKLVDKNNPLYLSGVIRAMQNIQNFHELCTESSELLNDSGKVMMIDEVDEQAMNAREACRELDTASNELEKLIRKH